MPKKLVLTCLFNFLIAALMGLTLRYTFVSSVSFNYRFLTHAHSHVAMLGWVYLMLYTFFAHYFIPDIKSIYIKLFWLTQIAVMGMMISFPFQGYTAISISFSTLHIFCSYYFAYRFWKDMHIQNILIRQLVKASLLFMAISTLGVWCLGPAVSILGPASAFYQIAIQFFLNFQFNGWFLLAVLAIMFYQLKIQPSKDSQLFFKFLIVSTVLTFALPIQWFANHPLLYWINGVGILLQLVSLYYFLRMVKLPFRIFQKQSLPVIKRMYYFALFCFILKTTLQTLSIIPQLASELYEHHNLIIGFIHLAMLGVISGFLFAFLLQSKTIMPTALVSAALYLFLLGFIFTEALLFIQGAFYYFNLGIMPNYYILLFSASILLPLSIAIILMSYINQKHYGIQTP
ncbi:hypothetical protein [Bizionia myxarmorum]|uniref:Cytochrome C oxidase subunit I n=1 Tax=Bizionia myxarmorum TaxID=291186 RepID=A0A5D0R608_9FLAO|nr:hypothetical protein [Bizionia myxarmorum]TYB77070.1 hypothetical protein ES674_10280 [Bizionia myxarmorum]